MDQTIYDCIAWGAVIATAILLVVLLNVANSRARARMTPQERAEHDEDVSRFGNVQLATSGGKASLAGDPSEQPQREEAATHSVGG